MVHGANGAQSPLTCDAMAITRMTGKKVVEVVDVVASSSLVGILLFSNGSSMKAAKGI